GKGSAARSGSFCCREIRADRVRLIGRAAPDAVRSRTFPGVVRAASATRTPHAPGRLRPESHPDRDPSGTTPAGRTVPLTPTSHRSRPVFFPHVLTTLPCPVSHQQSHHPTLACASRLTNNHTTMSNATIRTLKAREILDSRGNPTVEVE